MAKVAGTCHFSYFLYPLYLLYLPLSALFHSILTTSKTTSPSQINPHCVLSPIDIASIHYG